MALGIPWVGMVDTATEGTKMCIEHIGGIIMVARE